MENKQIEAVIEQLMSWVAILKSISAHGSVDAAKAAMRHSMEAEKSRRLADVTALVSQMNADGHAELRRAKAEAARIVENARAEAQDIIAYVTRKPKKRINRRKVNTRKAKR